MNPPLSRWLLLLGLAGGLAAGGYAYRRGQASQANRLACIEAVAAQLAANNAQCAEANAAMMRTITYYACRNRTQAADVAVLAQAQTIRGRTQTLLDTLNLVRQQLRSGAAGLGWPGSLGRQAKRYAAFIRRYFPAKTPFAPTLTITAAQGSFEQLLAGKLPLPVALAGLTQLEVQLRRAETRALQTQAEKVGSNYDGFDKLVPLAVPTTDTVLPGGVYQAQLLLAQSSHWDFCNMDMTANGVPLTQRNSLGMQVEFAVPARRPGQPDTVRAQWHGTIRGPQFPGDTVLQLAVPYLIVSPPTP